MVDLEQSSLSSDTSDITPASPHIQPSNKRDMSYTDDCSSPTTHDKKMKIHSDTAKAEEAPVTPTHVVEEQQQQDEKVGAITDDACLRDEITPAPQALLDQLFTHTLKFFRDNGGFMATRFADCEDQDAFIRAIYDGSLEDSQFWLACKQMLIGQGSTIDVINTTSDRKFQAIIPVQFGGHKRVHSMLFKNTEIGDFGEDWVLHCEGVDFAGDFTVLNKAGKICWDTCPIASTTPDYVVVDPSNTSTGGPIKFEGGCVMGVGECKTSMELPACKGLTPWTAKDLTVGGLLKMTKPKSIVSVFTSGKKRLKAPSWLKDTTYLINDVRKSVEVTSRWSLLYRENPGGAENSERIVRSFDSDIPDNNYFINIFNTAIGRQVLCEMISVRPYCERHGVVTAYVYMPTVKQDTHTDEYTTLFCLRLEFHLTTDILKKLETIIVAGLAGSLNQYAKKLSIF